MRRPVTRHILVDALLPALPPGIVFAASQIFSDGETSSPVLWAAGITAAIAGWFLFVHSVTDRLIPGYALPANLSALRELLNEIGSSPKYPLVTKRIADMKDSPEVQLSRGDSAHIITSDLYSYDGVDPILDDVVIPNLRQGVTYHYYLHGSDRRTMENHARSFSRKLKEQVERVAPAEAGGILESRVFFHLVAEPLLNYFLFQRTRRKGDECFWYFTTPDEDPLTGTLVYVEFKDHLLKTSDKVFDSLARHYKERSAAAICSRG